MKTFIEDYINEGILGIITLVLSVILLATVAMLILTLINEVNIDTKPVELKVEQVEFVPAHTTTTMVTVGKTMIPQTHRHPDAWEVTVQVSGESLTCDLSSPVSEGEWITVNIGEGRLFGGFICD